jgi:hypothetical protein
LETYFLAFLDAKSLAIFRRMRWLPVHVSRSPVEFLFLSLLVASGCYFYLANWFSWSLTGGAFAIHQRLALNRQWRWSRYIFDGVELKSLPGDDEADWAMQHQRVHPPFLLVRIPSFAFAF